MCIRDRSIADNAILGSQGKHTKGPFLNTRKIREYAEKLITRFGVRATSIATKAGKLSGGNLQKLILGTVSYTHLDVYKRQCRKWHAATLTMGSI